jgi:hypothetical protein
LHSCAQKGHQNIRKQSISSNIQDISQCFHDSRSSDNYSFTIHCIDPRCLNQGWTWSNNLSCVVLIIPASLNEGMQYLTLYQAEWGSVSTTHSTWICSYYRDEVPTRVHIASISCVTKKYSIFPESNKGQWPWCSTNIECR